MDGLTKLLLLLDLGYDAHNPWREEYVGKLLNRGEIVLIDGPTDVSGWGRKNGVKFELHKKRYMNCAITNTYCFSPHDYLNGRLEAVEGEMRALHLDSKERLIKFEMFNGEDFTELNFRSAEEVPWLPLPKLRIFGGVNERFLYSAMFYSLTGGMRGFFFQDQHWYQSLSPGIKFSLGDQGNHHYLLIFNKPGEFEDQQREKITEFLKSYTGVCVRGKDSDWPEFFDPEVPREVASQGVVIEINKCSGYKIPGLIEGITKRLS